MPRAAKAKREPVKAAGRLIGYGSTRYSTQGSTRKAPRLKAVGVNVASTMANQKATTAVGAALGAKYSAGDPKAVVGGAIAGNVMGLAAGKASRSIQAKRGYTHRTKQRMSLRAINSSKFTAQPMNTRNAKTSVRAQSGSATTVGTKSRGRVGKKGY